MEKMFLLIPSSNQEIEIGNQGHIKFLDYEVPSPEIENQYNKINGVHGTTNIRSIVGLRKIPVNFFIETNNDHDFKLIEREIHDLFFIEEPYFIRFSKMPGIRYLVNPTPFSLEKINHGDGQLTIEFDNFTGFGESVGTTQNLVEYHTELWQFGMRLPNAEDLIYTHNTRKFKIYNASNTRIDPRQHQLLDIHVKGIGAFELVNQTTNDELSTSFILRAGDEFKVSGVHHYLNNRLCGRETNHGLITLSKGWNEFELRGLAEFEVSFDFKFLYK